MHLQGPSSGVHTARGWRPVLPAHSGGPFGLPESCFQQRLLCVHLAKSCLHTSEWAVPSEEWVSLFRIRVKSQLRGRVDDSGGRGEWAAATDPVLPLQHGEPVSLTLKQCFVLFCAVKTLETSSCLGCPTAWSCFVCRSRACVLSKNEPRSGNGPADAPTARVLHTFLKCVHIGLFYLLSVPGQ